MNNFTFGNARHQYYETIAGGAGAGPDFDGASAVQTHMTNSRLTDPEILGDPLPGAPRALRDPPRLGRGGRAQRRRRRGAPHPLPRADDARASFPTGGGWRRAGIEGGGDAKPGVNKVVRADGSEEMLSATASAEMAAGDVFVIETPGGGGYGDASRSSPGRGGGPCEAWWRGSAPRSPPPPPRLFASRSPSPSRGGFHDPISPAARHPRRHPRLRAPVQSDAGRARRGAGHRAARRARSRRGGLASSARRSTTAGSSSSPGSCCR